MRRAGTRLPLPVICIGNFIAGGAGKTPAALALGRRLIERGERPFYVSRGYRSTAEHHGPVLVDLMHHNARDVGDEPLLLARVAPTIVGADRVAGGRLALARGASLLILDDGLQNPSLHKDLCLVVVDAATGIGNGLCLPAGPLRAPLAVQMDRANAVIMVGKGRAGEALAARARAADRPIMCADLAIAPDVAARLAGQKVYAFAGIALPQKFYASLAAAGAIIVGMAPFPDHHVYNAQEIRRLQTVARDFGARLVTTEKDIVRLSDPEICDKALPAPTAVAISMEIADAPQLDEFLAAALAAARARLILPAACRA